MSQTVQEILRQIQELSDEERLRLEEQLADLTEMEWKQEAEEARRVARQKGLDQAAIDQAIREVRSSS